ncbi:CBO0543 family protein [Bacillus massilinigeriensis]|uniref:CBO0543 family protein n=1 Tax=Bacillus massilionigeriensis TaxID=1805475 RepID=UPI00096B3FB3|nr:CBO0543 family protein [Bacillus massilionigeriensis]
MRYTSLIPYFVASLFASLLGTYLDLYFVGKKLYSFPRRNFSEIFSIEILIPLLILPIATVVVLSVIQRMEKWTRLCFLLFISSLVPLVEKVSEDWGFFQHSEQWRHGYSFIGYLLFFLVIWRVFQWTKNWF